MARDIVVGLAMGTTATKVVAFTADGRAVAEASHGYPLDVPAPGRAEQDPRLILDAVVRGIREVVASVGSDRVAGLSFSSAMHSLLALDENGEPLTNVVTWADTRASAVAERIRDNGGLEVHRRTGTPIHPMSPLVKLAWFRENEPALAAARWAGIKDWIILQMTGRLVVDHSLASGMGLMNMHELDWDAEALSVAGVTAAQLPTLVATTDVVGGLLDAFASWVGLDEGTPVVAGAGDGPLANLGVGAVRPGVAALSIGTSGALRVAVDKPAVDEAGGVFCYALTADRWVVGGAINNGGVTLDWVREQVGGETSELLDEALEIPAGSGGLLMLPYLLGERAPHWGGTARGAYIGLTKAHSRGHLVRAAVEGVSLQLALVKQSLESAGLDIAEIRATGGVMRHELWRQTLASAIGSAMSFPSSSEGSCLGGAILGMQALGLIDSIDEAAALVPVEASLPPLEADAEVYARLLPSFAALYELLEPTNKLLATLA